ncbi:MAG: hypothetical protein HFH86_00410 [Bacilli bacterium]|nr:hypothetical protein [Bacilli bacterium]
MVNLEHKLTVDDLIVEYMIYKVKNGYDPKFLANEFIQFLLFFESKIPVQDSLYDNKKLFQRFFKRKSEDDWSTINWLTGKKIENPHMDFIEQDSKIMIAANYQLSDYDRSMLNTYFMSERKVQEIRNLIEEFVSCQPKRKIKESEETTENDIIVGKIFSAKIIFQIWNSYIKNQIKNYEWSKQCIDMNKYLFDMDLAKMMEMKSIKKEIVELYNSFSKKVSILYHQDQSLKISSYRNQYLARANYELLSQGYEKWVNNTFGPDKKTIDEDLTKILSSKNKTDKTLENNISVRKLIKNLEQEPSDNNRKK